MSVVGDVASVSEEPGRAYQKAWKPAGDRVNEWPRIGWLDMAPAPGMNRCFRDDTAANRSGVGRSQDQKRSSADLEGEAGPGH
ncbi:unnamed protein product [Clonostachys byssicola]|uniref:Uncharacterized protein n=1 Tax=Clonostachys byssicola TaxID=160290 RepID=A0A9N9YDN5_9HYPO|nr:unnamed protein product [Clonostachys byssicola]